MIVFENNQVCGMVTDRDIVVRTVAETQDPAPTTLADICSHNLLTVTPTDSVEEAVRLMRTHAIRRLPVVDGGQAVGIVSLGDLAVERDPGSALGRLATPHPTLNGGRPAPPTPREFRLRMKGGERLLSRSASRTSPYRLFLSLGKFPAARQEDLRTTALGWIAETRG